MQLFRGSIKQFVKQTIHTLARSSIYRVTGKGRDTALSVGDGDLSIELAKYWKRNKTFDVHVSDYHCSHELRNIT